MTVEKTDAQEREALAKIREILKDFDPEETYIGKAFDGCVELAEENIRNDWLYSWKGRYLDEQLKNNRLSDKVEALTKTLNRKDDAIARYVDVVQKKDREISRLNGVIDNKDTAYTDLEGRLEGAKETADGLKQTILELKAKLYDLMVSRKEVIHSDEEG